MRVVTASQKGWLSPPGIAMAALSERGWAAAETSTMPSFYFDLKAHHEYAVRGQPPWTPALPTLYAMDAALLLMAAEGPEAIFARHHRFAAWTRAGDALHGAGAVGGGTVRIRHRHRRAGARRRLGPALSKRLREQYDVVIAGGQGKLATSIFRIGHLGFLDEGEMADCFRALRSALVEEGFAPAEGAELPGIDGAV